MKPQDSIWIPGSPRADKRGSPQVAAMSNELTPTTNYIDYYCIYYASRGDGTAEEATTRKATEKRRRPRQEAAQQTEQQQGEQGHQDWRFRGIQAPRSACVHGRPEAKHGAQCLSLPPLRRQGPSLGGKPNGVLRWSHLTWTHLNLSSLGTPELTFKSLA
jgi:hypothetical protein